MPGEEINLKRILCLLVAACIIFSGIGIHANDGSTGHIIINQFYGGGEENDGKDMETPVSHAFIELYNPTDKIISLDNWSLQYASSGNLWKVYTLNGEIKPHSSYLVRYKAYNSDARLQIKNYDALWDIGINNKGCKILLKSNTETAKTANPYGSGESGYADMIGVAGNRYYYSIDGCETDYAQIQSKQKAIRRVKFADTDNNAKDFAAIDYRTADIGEVGPRYSGDGEWTYTEFKRTKEINAVPLDTETDKSEFSFLHVSDTQASTGSQFAEWGRLTALLANENYDFTIHTGDITDNNDNTAEMDMFYENSGSIMTKPFIPVVGNHDQKSTTYAKLFKEYFGNTHGTEAPSPIPEGTTASFDYGTAHFIVLNTESDLETQKQWLESELSKTDKKWKIVAMHRSPYGAAGVNDTVIFVPVFDKYHVDLVIHGHDHLYLRSAPLYNGKKTPGGTVYLESGSSGSKQENGIAKQTYDEVCVSPKSPTYSKITVSDGAISVKAEYIDDTGKLKCIDKFDITKYNGTYADVKETKYDIPERDFSDVKPNSSYTDALTLLSSLGIIEKTTIFRPNGEISSSEFISWLNKASGIYPEPESDVLTYETAVKLILKRLGYDEYIKLSNSDYTITANDIGLYKNINKNTSVLTRAVAAQLIANALEAYTIELDSITGERANYHQVYTSWLDKVHNVYKIRGIIKDRPFYRSNSSNTSVLFETEYGENLTAEYSENIYSLLGYEIDAYIRNPYDAKGETESYKISQKKYDKLGVGAVNFPALAEHKINGGYIYDIDFDMDFKEYGVFTCLKNTCRLGNYFYNDDTVIFLYDGVKNDENSQKSDRYYSVTPEYLKNKHAYSADIFKVEKNYLPQIFVLYDNNKDVSIDDSIIIVSDISQVLNEHGENVYCLTGYSKGRKISLEFLPGADNLPKKDDVIQYAQNPDKKITLYNTLCNYETADFEKNTFLDDISYSKCNTIETVNNGIITVNRQGNYVNYYTNNNTVVYNIENSDRNNISVGSADDITNGDRIFITLKEGVADEIFVWKNQ